VGARKKRLPMSNLKVAEMLVRHRGEKSKTRGSLLDKRRRGEKMKEEKLVPLQE